MRGTLVVAVVSFAVRACGTGEERSGGGPASTSAVDAPTRSVSEEEAEAEADAEAQSPPPFVLVSEAGEQQGIQGSSCVGTEGVVACAYGPDLNPQSLSVVHPGEDVRLVLEGAESARGEFHLLRLGCTERLFSIGLTGPETEWTVDLEAGTYELELSADFTMASSEGDMTATVGLQVDPDADASIVPAPAPLPDCPDSQPG